MRAARLRLIVASVLLFGWLGWLAYLAWFKTNPVVVSRSQAMASTYFVLADVTVNPATGLPERKVKVVQNLRPQGDPIPIEITVNNLEAARVGGGKSFAQPGPYLLMLSRNDLTQEFVLTPPPRSPGDDRLPRPAPWAYVWDAPGVREQFEALVPAREE